MQGRVCADGHVRAAEVVVDGAHHAHDVEGRVLLGRVLADQACRQGSVWGASDTFQSIFKFDPLKGSCCFPEMTAPFPFDYWEWDFGGCGDLVNPFLFSDI